MVFNQLNVHQTDPSGFFKIKTTEISKAENYSFHHQISSWHCFYYLGTLVFFIKL